MTTENIARPKEWGKAQSRCFTEFILSPTEGFSMTQPKTWNVPKDWVFLDDLCVFARDNPIWLRLAPEESQKQILRRCAPQNDTPEYGRVRSHERCG